MITRHGGRLPAAFLLSSGGQLHNIIAPAATRLMRVADKEEPHDHIWRRLYDGVLHNFGFPVWLRRLRALVRRAIVVHGDSVVEGESALRCTVRTIRFLKSSFVTSSHRTVGVGFALERTGRTALIPCWAEAIAAAKVAMKSARLTVGMFSF